MEAQAVIGSLMEPMSRFTGRLSFTIYIPFRDAQRARLPGDHTKFRFTIRSATGYAKTREIIGSYSDEYKPDTRSHRDWMGVATGLVFSHTPHRHNSEAKSTLGGLASTK